MSSAIFLRQSPDAFAACHSAGCDHCPGSVRGGVPVVAAAALPHGSCTSSGAWMAAADQPGVGGHLQRAVCDLQLDRGGVLARRDQPRRIRLGLRVGAGCVGVAPDPFRTHHARPVLPAQPMAGAGLDRVGRGPGDRRDGAGLA